MSQADFSSFSSDNSSEENIGLDEGKINLNIPTQDNLEDAQKPLDNVPNPLNYPESIILSKG